MYKLVALDLDGTLLNPDKNLSIYSKKIIEALTKKGIKVVIATGRTFTAANHYHMELGLETPVISCNGGFIYDPINMDVVYGKEIDSESLEAIIDILDDLGVYYQYYGAKTIYTKWLAYLTAEWTEKNKSLPQNAKINIEIVQEPQKEIVMRNEPIYKVLVTDESHEIREKIWNEFKRNENLELVVSIGSSVDIMSAGITKGNALAHIAAYYGVDMSETIAIGDNHNDISMIQMAGCGIAMDNAEEKVKEFADIIAPSNVNEGVGVILNKIFELDLEEA